MIIDTDVLIWYLRGNKKAFKIIENENDISLSIITYMELLQGMRNKNEINILKKQLKAWDAKIIQINELISTRAMFYVEQNFLSHSMEMQDAFIGATAVVNGVNILTGNFKHYKPIKELDIIQFKP